MKHLLIAVVVLSVTHVFAQGYNGMNQDFENPFQGDEGYYEEAPVEQTVCPVPSEEQKAADRAIAMRAFEITNGACDFRSNPHSYACTRIAFEELLFPFFPMDWWGQMNTPWNLQGAWFAVTYVEDSGSENNGAAFYMEKNRKS